ncbi:MAG TPA: D-alanyl-D-alanine carboxypeptidase, partial [Fimbriimonadaceae bacterium]|nr:D-alanyl-D-alanine carboxypeptidase [Fimbriimonadaceae bacterium]
PMLTYEQLVDARKKLGIVRSMPVRVKQAYAPGIPPSWELDDLPNKYAAPVTAFTVNRGSFELWADNSKAVLEPESFGVRITRAPGKDRSIEYDPFAGTLRITGDVPKTRTRLDTLALKRPDQAAASVLAGAIAQTDSVPTTSPDLVIEGPSLREIVKECLVRSDNNLAEHLLLMAASKEGPLGRQPYDAATKRLKEFLVKRVGVSESDVRPYDGSGMSRHNLVTARAYAQLLRWGRSQPGWEIWPELMASPGKGTLNNRLQGSSFKGKTGTLDLVSSLSGYITSKDGQPVVLSIILNHYLGSAADARAVADEFVRKIESTELGNGTLLDSQRRHEGPFSLAVHSTPDGDRIYGSRGHRRAPLAGPHP